jgi:hypothetical protein
MKGQTSNDSVPNVRQVVNEINVKLPATGQSK